MTFRFFGHVFGDNDAYMDAGEKAAAMEKDPVPAYRHKLLAQGVATEMQLAGIEAEIAAQIEDAEQFALQSPFPDPVELGTDIYAEALT
jgi:pyruvate dehydrogenase E1 component alpha subunit